MDAARWHKVSDLMERAQPLTRRSRRALLERLLAVPRRAFADPLGRLALRRLPMQAASGSR